MTPAATTSSATSTAIDLSRLPRPSIVESLDFETILTRLKSDFVDRFPAYNADLESDPATKLLEVIAYQELIIRQRINEAAQANMIAFARAADLDNLAAVFGVLRLEVTPADLLTGAPAVMESDTDLRRRVLLAPDAYSVAGPTAAYVFHALGADGDVLDASAVSPAPGEVVVSVLSRTGDGLPSAEVLDLVTAAVAGDTVRPLTDQVTVQAAQLVDLAIEAQLTVYPGPDQALLLQTALANLDDYLAGNHRLGRDVTRSALFAALHVGGVQNVTILSPAADVVLDETQAWRVTGIDVTVAGRAE